MIYYFNTLPKTVTQDASGNSVLVTDLLARSSMIRNVLANPLLFYTYDIKDSDTPEIIADKYYENSYRYWIIMFVNEIFSPQWDWPLNPKQLGDYIENKYESSSDIHHYEKITEQYESGTKTTTTEKFQITQEEYDDLDETTLTYTIGDSSTTITTTKKIISNYEYEFELNESKRNIKLLKSDYVFQIENELRKLMNK